MNLETIQLPTLPELKSELAEITAQLTSAKAIAGDSRRAADEAKKAFEKANPMPFLGARNEAWSAWCAALAADPTVSAKSAAFSADHARVDRLERRKVWLSNRIKIVRALARQAAGEPLGEEVLAVAVSGTDVFLARARMARGRYVAAELAYGFTDRATGLPLNLADYYTYRNGGCGAAGRARLLKELKADLAKLTQPAAAI